MDMNKSLLVIGFVSALNRPWLLHLGIVTETDQLKEIILNQGFIKLHRKICKWEWYQDPNTFRLFIHLLLIANHEDRPWKGIIVKRGQTITGLKSLNEALGLSVQQLRTSLNKLKSTSEITIKPTNKYSLITIAGYDSYQDRDKIATSKTTDKSTHEQQTNNKPSTTNKNYKNVKNKDIWEIPEWVNIQAWQEFEQHRKDINKPLSILAKTKAANCLNGFTPEEQQAAIDTTIQNRWTGIFPKKLNGEGNETNQRNRNNGSGQQSNLARVSQLIQNDLKKTSYP